MAAPGGRVLAWRAGPAPRLARHGCPRSRRAERRPRHTCLDRGPGRAHTPGVQPPSPVPPSTVPAGLSDPVGDLARAARVWRRYPLLPAATAAVAIVVCMSGASGGVAALAALAGLLFVGWPGTERLF